MFSNRVAQLSKLDLGPAKIESWVTLPILLVKLGGFIPYLSYYTTNQLTTASADIPLMRSDPCANEINSDR